MFCIYYCWEEEGNLIPRCIYLHFICRIEFNLYYLLKLTYEYCDEEDQVLYKRNHSYSVIFFIYCWTHHDSPYHDTPHHVCAAKYTIYFSPIKILFGQATLSKLSSISCLK